MPSYPCTFRPKHTPSEPERLLVMIEHFHDLMVDVRAVTEAAVRQPLALHFGPVAAKNRFAALTVLGPEHEFKTILRSILPDDLPTNYQALQADQERLLRLATSFEAAVAAITASRPRLNEPREVALTPHVLKVFLRLRQRRAVNGIEHCRGLVSKSYGEEGRTSLASLEHHGLIWRHPLIDLTFVATNVTVKPKPVLVY